VIEAKPRPKPNARSVRLIAGEYSPGYALPVPAWVFSSLDDVASSLCLLCHTSRGRLFQQRLRHLAPRAADGLGQPRGSGFRPPRVAPGGGVAVSLPRFRLEVNTAGNDEPGTIPARVILWLRQTRQPCGLAVGVRSVMLGWRAIDDRVGMADPQESGLPPQNP
jgi:hypothetical protein